MSSVFSKIVKGEIPCHKIAETEDYLAFLDINPLAKGHTLVIPKEETNYIFDLDDDELGGLMIFAKKVAMAIKARVACSRVGVTVIGLEVPHAHVHLIPINMINDMNFAKPKLNFTQEELAEIATDIAKFYRA